MSINQSQSITQFGLLISFLNTLFVCGLFTKSVFEGTDFDASHVDCVNYWIALPDEDFFGHI